MWWQALLGGIGQLLGKIPIQGRKERWKNEMAQLQKESDGLINKTPTKRSADRVAYIRNRIAILNQFLHNSADAN